MIIRERDKKAKLREKKALQDALVSNRERAEEIRAIISNLEDELDMLESNILNAERKLKDMEEEENKKPVLARNKPRPKNEAKLINFNLV